MRVIVALAIVIIIKYERAVVVEIRPCFSPVIVHMQQRTLHKFHCAFSEMGLSR